MIESLAIPSRHCRIALAALAGLSGLALMIPAPAAAASTTRSADRASYVLFAQGNDSTSMSGSTDDMKRARALRVGEEALLYVRHGGKAYVIRDAATLRRAESIFEPQKVLGGRQAELGSRQAALGSRQAALGAQQARLGAQQATATPARAGELDRQQEELGRQQDALGRQQDALGKQQDVLGREQDRLGREAEAKFRVLLADALQSGVAKPVN